MYILRGTIYPINSINSKHSRKHLLHMSERVKDNPLSFGRRILSSLKNPAYRIYFFATLAHFAAMSMQIVTSPLLIYRLTERPALLGTMSLVGAAPMIAISFFGGAFADRMQKKKIIIAGLLGYAIMALGIG